MPHRVFLQLAAPRDRSLYLSKLSRCDPVAASRSIQIHQRQKASRHFSRCRSMDPMCTPDRLQPKLAQQPDTTSGTRDYRVGMRTNHGPLPDRAETQWNPAQENPEMIA